MDEDTLTILVIEDEDLLLAAISKKLALNNIKTITTKSGKEALEILKSLDKLPNAIWLDYYLKDMNGLEFMSAVKNDKKLSSIPTVVVSNSASPEKVNNMLTLGVKKYYLKAESKLDDIVSHVKDLIQRETYASPQQ